MNDSILRRALMNLLLMVVSVLTVVVPVLRDAVISVWQFEVNVTHFLF